MSDTGSGSGFSGGGMPPRPPGFFTRPEDQASSAGGLYPRSEVPVGFWQKHGTLLRAAIVVTSFTVFLVVVWGAYQQGHKAGAHDTPPVIKADVNPTRIRPENPGGMEIPHQDKMVYDRLNPEIQEKRSERLLSPPESPLPKPRGLAGDSPIDPEIAAQSDPGSSPGEGLENIPAPQIPSEAPPQILPQPPASSSRNAPVPLTRESAPAVKAPESLTPPPVAGAILEGTEGQASATPSPPAPPLQKQTAGVSGQYRIQLGAMRTEEAAQKGWQNLVSLHKDILGSLQLNIVKADLGSKGTFFRIQAGVLESEVAARQLCEQLKNQKVSCLVVSP